MPCTQLDLLPQTEPKLSGLFISFGYTYHELENCGKCVTRRDWKDSHAAKFIKAFNQGAYVRAFDKDMRYQGQQVGWLTLTTAPYQEALVDMPETEVALEGFPGLSKEEFLARFFKKFDLSKPIWVVRFEYHKEITEQCKNTQFYPSSVESPSFVTAESATPDLNQDSLLSTSLSAIHTANDSSTKITAMSVCGETSEPSGDNPVNSSLWWAEVPAKTTPELTLRAKDLQAIALGFGGNNSGSSKNADPQLFSGKTQQDADTRKETTNFLPLESFSGRLSPAGIVASGSQYELVNLERPTKGTGFSLLPTPLTCSSDSALYRRPGQDKLEKRLRRELSLIPGMVSHPEIREWMLGLCKNSTLLHQAAGGVPIPLMVSCVLPSEVSPIEGSALQPSETVAPPSRQLCVGDTSTTSPDALSLQPMESDVGKSVYVDAVEKRGIFLGGIHQRVVKGTTVTLGAVQFCDSKSPSIFPVEEIELVPGEEKATVSAAADQINITGENIMLAQDLDAFVTLDLSAEIAKHEEQLKQIHSKYDADVAKFKKRGVTKSEQQYKSTDKKYAYNTSLVTNQIAILKSCQSLPIGSSVTHQEKGDGVLKGFVIDVRKVVMAVVVFELGEAEVAPHSLKAIKGNALSVKPVVTPQVESEITEASPEQETIQQSEPTLAAVPDDADAIATAVEIAGSSDQDECERIITEINELDAKFEFEVGRRLLRLQQIWKPSHEFRLFGDYCEAKLGRKFSKTRRNELINAAKVQDALPNSPAFTSTNATKPVWRMLAAGVAPEEVQELVKEVAASGNLTKEAIENKAQDKGLLPKKSAPKPATTAEQETKAIGQQLGLPGIGERQLPDVAPNAGIEPAAIKPLKDCVTMNEVIDAILASPASAFEEFRLVDWQERNRLRELCSDISTRFRALESEEFHVGAMLTFLELADKDSKIEWLETQLAGVRVPLATDASVEEYIESLSVEQLQDAQIKIAARLMELGLEEVKPASTRTDEWYTPPEYIEMAREVMGSIDLDPASNDLAQSWIQAAQYYTKNDDGLSKAWLGNVWCNPPYGRDVENWLVDALCRYECGEIKSAILLLNRTGAAWYRARIKEVTAICEVYKRIAFIDGNGERQASPRHYNDFLYLGTDVEKFREVFSAVGDVRVTQHLEQAAV